MHNHTCEHECYTDEIESRWGLIEKEESEHGRSHGQQREQHGESTHRNTPQRVLIDAVGDCIGEQTDKDAQANQRGVTPSGTTLRKTDGCEYYRTDGETDSQAGNASVVLCHACPEHDVDRPTNRGQEDVEQTERFVVDFDSREHHNTNGSQGQRECIAFRASGQCCDGDRTDEFDCNTLSEVESVDRQVERQVHERSSDAKERSCLQLLTGESPTATQGPSRKEQQPACGAEYPKPCRRSRCQLLEQPNGNDGADVLADTRENEQRLGWRGVERVARGVQSNKSGSVRQISCHSGWKFNQPAIG